MKIGAQLYTIREHMQNLHDFSESMKKISDTGFDCVQVSGASVSIYAKAIAEICGEYGLEIAVTHTDAARILEKTEEVIAEHKLMGTKYIGIGMIPGKYERNANGFTRFISDYKRAAAEIKNAGLQLMYHNHQIEFEKFGGTLVMDLLFEDFADINFTLDTYWVQVAGGDPAYWIRRLGARAEILHLKDCEVINGEARMCEVLQGNMNWHAIFNAANEAGVKYALIEQDDCYGKDPFECLRTSLENLKGDVNTWCV